ncbi:MAG: tRNA lysidine(34) synthetase TilS [Armatimonadota bacterium]
MLRNIIQAAEKYNLINPGEKTILAISGGPDSVFLLDFFSKIRKKYNLQLYVLHINHSIRKKESGEEAVFVKNMAKKLNLPFYYYKEDVPEYAKAEKLSLEEAARNTRLRIYNELLKKLKADKVATGHNSDDRAETVLMRIIKGTSPSGLAAMEPCSGKIIRPLIEVKRKDIITYLKKNKIKYVIDKSNKDTKFFRNKIRHKLIPLLEEEYNPNIKESLIKLSSLAGEDEEALQSAVLKKLNKLSSVYKDKIEIDITDINNEHPSIIKRIIKSAIKTYLGHAKDITNYHYEKIYNFLKDQKGEKKLNLPDGLTAVKSYNKLTFHKKTEKKHNILKQFRFTVPGRYNIKGWDITVSTSLVEKIKAKPDSNTAYFDFDKLNTDTLILRQRKDGDIFIPFGMKGRKKIKDLFIDLKIPLEKRNNIPIITAENNIIWVTGYRISEKYRVDKNTKRILKIEVKGETYAS